MPEEKRICIIEDDQDIRSVLQQILELEGYVVKTAGNGQEALALLNHEAWPADLILLDLMMPVMNGWEFLQRAEKLIQSRSIPVVVMSAGSLDQWSFPPDVVSKLKKPIDVDHLLGTLNKVHIRKRPAA
jgi:CheY-like chemotaxis protein